MPKDGWAHAGDSVDEGPTLAYDETLPHSTSVFNGVGLDLDLDLSLNDEPAQVHIPAEVATAVLLSETSTPSSESALSAQAAMEPAVVAERVLDLDFSGLGELETFTIKKSGKPV